MVIGDLSTNKRGLESSAEGKTTPTTLIQDFQFTPAPKKPTKNQLIYERLKASMENEKNRPKKEVKSKVSESLKTFSTPKSVNRGKS